MYNGQPLLMSMGKFIVMKTTRDGCYFLDATCHVYIVFISCEELAPALSSEREDSKAVLTGKLSYPGVGEELSAKNIMFMLLNG